MAYAKDAPADKAKVLDLILSKTEEAYRILRYKAYVKEADRLSLSEQELEGLDNETTRLAKLKNALGQ